MTCAGGGSTSVPLAASLVMLKKIWVNITPGEDPEADRCFHFPQVSCIQWRVACWCLPVTGIVSGLGHSTGASNHTLGVFYSYHYRSLYTLGVFYSYHYRSLYTLGVFYSYHYRSLYTLGVFYSYHYRSLYTLGV